jgi:maltodextrin utilization protein YvdJ
MISNQPDDLPTLFEYILMINTGCYQRNTDSFDYTPINFDTLYKELKQFYTSNDILTGYNSFIKENEYNTKIFNAYKKAKNEYDKILIESEMKQMLLFEIMFQKEQEQQRLEEEYLRFKENRLKSTATDNDNKKK